MPFFLKQIREIQQEEEEGEMTVEVGHGNYYS